MKPSPRHAVVLMLLPLMLTACGALLQPKSPPTPWVPTQPLPEPGEQMPLYPPN